MDPTDETSQCVVYQPQVSVQMKQYQGYSVSTVPLGLPVQQHDVAGPAPPPPQQYPDVEEEEFDEDEEEEPDYQLEASVLSRRPPPAPVPGQLAKFHHLLKVGVFVATIEVLTDRAEGDLQNIRKEAQKKADELIASTGEVEEQEIPGRPICGTPKFQRDYKRMSKHIEYFTDLCNKFVEEFDGTPARIRKIRSATGFIKGLLAKDGQRVFNIVDKPVITEAADLLDLFKVNAILFLEYIMTYRTD